MRLFDYFINKINSALILKNSYININRYNSICLQILMILQKLNIIESFLINSDLNLCTIFFNLKNNYSYFSKIICVSKPNRFIYYSINDLIKLRSMDLYNDYILSTNIKNNTIITIDDAIQLHTGGLLLLKIIRTK